MEDDDTPLMGELELTNDDIIEQVQEVMRASFHHGAASYEFLMAQEQLRQAQHDAQRAYDGFRALIDKPEKKDLN